MTYEKLPKKCNVCGKKIILTNSQIVFGKLSGDQMYFFCNYCKAWTVAKYNEETKLYEATGILATKKMRTLQKEILEQLEKEYTQNVPPKYQKYLRNLAYKIIAGYLKIEKKDCYIATLNINQLNDVKTVMNHFWDPFIYEKRKIMYFTQLGEDINTSKPKGLGRKNLKIKELTEEEKLEIQEQTNYILRGRQHVYSKTKALKKK